MPSRAKAARRRFRPGQPRLLFLAICLHNDDGGRLHLSRPPIPEFDAHLARMALFEELLREHTWFTEGSTGGEFRNAGTLGESWLMRYGIDALIAEFNCN